MDCIEAFTLLLLLLLLERCVGFQTKVVSLALVSLCLYVCLSLSLSLSLSLRVCMSFRSGYPARLIVLHKEELTAVSLRAPSMTWSGMGVKISRRLLCLYLRL